MRMVAYSNDAGPDGFDRPNALIAVSAEVEVPAGQARGWVEFKFQGQTIPKGRCFLGLWFGGSGDAVLLQEKNLGSMFRVGQAYSSSAEPSAMQRPTPSTNGGVPGIYVEYSAPKEGAPSASHTAMMLTELPASTPVNNVLSGPHRWRGDAPWVPDQQEKVHYERFFWSEIESAQGVYDFTPVRKVLSAAKSQGMAFAMRVRARDGTQYRLPAYLASSTSYWSDSFFRSRHQALHTALRNELADEIVWLDIDGPGNYGEWSKGDYANYSEATRRLVHDGVTSVWANKGVELVTFLGPAEMTQYAVDTDPSVGFRDDVWGSEGGSYEMWKKQSEKARAHLLRSSEEGRLITGEMHGGNFGYAARTLLLEVLFIGPHSVSNGNNQADLGSFANQPAADQEDMRLAFSKLGHRLVFTRVDRPSTVRLGTAQAWRFYIHNRNVAYPVGRPWTTSLRLKNASGAVVWSDTIPVNVAKLGPTEVMPHVIDANLTISGIPAGAYTAEVILVDTMGHTMNLANASRTSDGAYSIGSVSVTQ
jgi:hypothetical protein